LDKSVSYFVNSSSHRAIADDSLKDEDNAAWITTLPPDVRQIWIERVGWIRLVDRLAEQDLLLTVRSFKKDTRE
jgi:phytoene synthase